MNAVIPAAMARRLMASMLTKTLATAVSPAKGIRLVGVTLSSFERPDSTRSEQLELGLAMLSARPSPW